jgi:hypothetical protein
MKENHTEFYMPMAIQLLMCSSGNWIPKRDKLKATEVADICHPGTVARHELAWGVCVWDGRVTMYMWTILLKGKAVPVTSREGPWGCERSRRPHFLDKRLMDGGEVVSLMRWPPFIPQECM